MPHDPMLAAAAGGSCSPSDWEIVSPSSPSTPSLSPHRASSRLRLLHLPHSTSDDAPVPSLAEAVAGAVVSGRFQSSQLQQQQELHLVNAPHHHQCLGTGCNDERDEEGAVVLTVAEMEDPEGGGVGRSREGTDLAIEAVEKGEEGTYVEEEEEEEKEEEAEGVNVNNAEKENSSNGINSNTRSGCHSHGERTTSSADEGSRRSRNRCNLIRRWRWTPYSWWRTTILMIISQQLRILRQFLYLRHLYKTHSHAAALMAVVVLVVSTWPWLRLRANNTRLRMKISAQNQKLSELTLQLMQLKNSLSKIRHVPIIVLRPATAAPATPCIV